MRIHDIINEAQTSLRVPPGDPILNDANLYKLLEHYLGKTFIGWAIENSPYNPSGRNIFQQAAAAAAKPTYDNVARTIIPLAAQENPDIERIMRIVFRIPGLVSQDDKIRILDTIDRTRAADAKNGWVWREKSPPPVTPAASGPDAAQVSSL